MLGQELVSSIVQFAQRTYRCVHIAKYGSVTVPLIFGVGGSIWLMVWPPFRRHHRQSRLNHLVNNQTVTCDVETDCAVAPLTTCPTHRSPALRGLIHILLSIPFGLLFEPSFTRFCAFHDRITAPGFAPVTTWAAISTPAVAIATFRRELIQPFHGTTSDAPFCGCTGRVLCSHTYRADRYLPNRYRSGGNQADCVAFTIWPYTDHLQGCVPFVYMRLGVSPLA